MDAGPWGYNPCCPSRVIMATMHVVPLCYRDKTERLCLLQGISPREVSTIIGALFQVPRHKRVVGLVGTTGVNDVVIPLLAACRYPDLVFEEQRRIGSVFQIVTKDAEREEEVLFPISALTTPPLPGCSDLPPVWASPLVELRGTTMVASMVPELIGGGMLTAEQGATVTDMVRAEDPVVFAACRVAAAAAAAAAGTMEAPPDTWKSSVGAASKGDVGCSNDDMSCSSRQAQSRQQGPSWNPEALARVAPMLRILVADRQNRKRGGRGGDLWTQSAVVDGAAEGGQEAHIYMRQSPAEAGRRAESRFVAASGVYGGVWGGGPGWSGREHDSEGLAGTTAGNGYSHDPGGLPEWFQSDAIALADVAFATGKISRTAYLGALYKAVTLDPDLVAACRADLHRQSQAHSSGDAVGAGLNAHRLQPAKDETFAAAVVPDAEQAPRQSSSAIAPKLASTGPPRAAETWAGHASGPLDHAASDDELAAQEATLRDAFLRQAVSLIEASNSDMTAHHRAIVYQAIAAQHPWVSAIYDECKETGDVRGLMQNLQRLPALLERDQAAAFAADVSQPPPPGEWDYPFFPRQSARSSQPRQDGHESRQARVPVNQHSVSNRGAHARPESTAPAQARCSQTLSSVASAGLGYSPAARGTSAASSSSRRGPPGATKAKVELPQLLRVVGGCATLLRLRGDIGDIEEKALNAMADRGSHVLQVAIEAHTVNQDMEDLLDTLRTAAEVQVALEAETTCAQATEAAPATQGRGGEQSEPTTPEAQRLEAGRRAPDSGGGRRLLSAGQDWSEAASSSPSVPVTLTCGEGGKERSKGAGDSREAAADSLKVVLMSTTAESLSKRKPRSAGADEVIEAAAIEKMEGTLLPSVSACDGHPGPSNSSSSDSNSSNSSSSSGGVVIVGSININNDNESNTRSTSGESAAESFYAGEFAVDSGGGSCKRETADTASVTRRTASSTRAQELASARFAGIRSAAEARASMSDDDDAQSTSTGSAPVGKGPREDAPTGDSRLRQDVSQLIAVMAKENMLTDRQRLFLLAQVGRPITDNARERHAHYVQSGDSKELYAVLVALSSPSPGNGTRVHHQEEGNEASDDDDENSSEDDGEEAEEDEDDEDDDEVVSSELGKAGTAIQQPRQVMERSMCGRSAMRREGEAHSNGSEAISLASLPSAVDELHASNAPEV